MNTDLLTCDSLAEHRGGVWDYVSPSRLSTASFYAWRRRLQFPCRTVPSQASRAALVPVHIVPEPSLAREGVIVEWPGGIVMRVATGCDEATLRTVVATLSAETAREATIVKLPQRCARQYCRSSRAK
jgi:hypothetical protein